MIIITLTDAVCRVYGALATATIYASVEFAVSYVNIQRICQNYSQAKFHAKGWTPFFNDTPSQRNVLWNTETITKKTIGVELIIFHDDYLQLLMRIEF
jgi:hypothetical protein